MNPLLALIDPVSKLLDKVIQDKDKKAEIAFELATLADKQAQELLKEQASIVREEAKSVHWITSAWRPLLMLVIIAIVAMNYLVFPLVNIVIEDDLMIELPKELWNLLQIGVGGYVVGRSGEKIAREIAIDKMKR